MSSGFSARSDRDAARAEGIGLRGGSNGYGLFTYNFLQGLNGAAKDAQGRVTLQSLYAYLKPRVQDDARRGNREQPPQLQGGGEDLVLRAR